jgi:hypothetical protein
MKSRPLFLAIAISLGLAVVNPVLAQTTDNPDQVKALKALVNKQQKQLDQQQQDIQFLRESVAKLQGQQVQQQAQIQAVATTPPPPPPAPAPAPPAAKPTFTMAPGLSVAFHGFFDVTAFSQSKNFTYGNGQNAEYPVPGASGTLSGVDLRNTRLMLDITGAHVSDNWNGGAHIEGDFFGGNNGTGAYAQQQPIPRLRQAYMILTNPTSGSTVKIGQQWDLMFPLDDLPESLSHFAFPLGYGTGLIGWRFPGIIYSQELNHGSSGPKWLLEVGAFEGTWNGPGSTINYLTAGNAGFRPQIEAKLHVEQPNEWMVFLAAHYSEINLAGVGGTEPTPIKRSFDSTGVELGGRWTPGKWVFRAVGYNGQGLGEIFGNLSQFGDIKETGGYTSVGYKFTPSWSANAFYAIAKPDTGDVIRWMGQGATGLLKNHQVALNGQYTIGDYAFGLEWIHSVLYSTTNRVNRISTGGNQYNLSAYYKF